LKIADRELARTEELEKKLDYISQQIEQLKIINGLPENVDAGADALVRRAIDVVSASLLYLAVHIRRESSSLGIIGNHLLLDKLTLK
jgi:hypothetical protein